MKPSFELRKLVVAFTSLALSAVCIGTLATGPSVDHSDGSSIVKRPSPQPLVPNCNYNDNPVIINCYHAGVLVAAYRCSDFGALGLPQGNVSTECTYTWCDSNMPCSSDYTKYQQKIRTKRLVSYTGSSLCPGLEVTSTSDANNGCCHCYWVTTDPDI
jgi:hypothetical protein